MAGTLEESIIVEIEVTKIEKRAVVAAEINIVHLILNIGHASIIDLKLKTISNFTIIRIIEY